MSVTQNNNEHDLLKVSIAQIAPVWLDREKTLDKIIDYTNQAADEQCDLVVFGEGVLPGYPFWLDLTEGSKFNSQIQKDIHAHYVDNAVQIEAGHLDKLCQLARNRSISVYVGCIERAADRGGHSLYCSLVYIDSCGDIKSVHRKLMPTYEERLTWSPGDGHGLRVHSLGKFTVGGLNCWENWMPLARAALYGQGEDLHVAVWPGGLHNTHDTTPFMAKEGRSFVLAASSVMRQSDFPSNTPHLKLILENAPELLANGGSAICGPDGNWLIEPCVGEEKLLVAEINHEKVRGERQNFDPVGHYSRPDVLKLNLNRQRQSTLSISDSDE